MIVSYYVTMLAVAIGAFYAGRWSGMEWVLRRCAVQVEDTENDQSRKNPADD